MKKETLNVTATNEGVLNVYAYHPEGTSKGIVHILHGMGEHAGRYDRFAKYLADQGLTVYAQDHRNHGKSVSDSEHVGIFDKQESFETMVDDVSKVQEYIRKHESDKPMTILGHSMGSALLRRFLEKTDKAPEKAIIMGTMPRYNILSGGVLYILASVSGLFYKKTSRNRFVNFLLNKSMTGKIPNEGSDLDWLSYDESNIQAYHDDPLSGFVYNKYFYNSFFKSLITLNKASEISKTPAVKTLFISGHDDPLSKNMRAINKLVHSYEKYVDGFDAEIKPIYKARHEILKEANYEYTYEYLLDWILNK